MSCNRFTFHTFFLCPCSIPRTGSKTCFPSEYENFFFFFSFKVTVWPSRIFKGDYSVVFYVWDSEISRRTNLMHACDFETNQHSLSTAQFEIPLPCRGLQFPIESFAIDNCKGFLFFALQRIVCSRLQTCSRNMQETHLIMKTSQLT